MVPLSAVPSREHATQLLLESSEGRREALDQMLPLVYEELRRLARQYLKRERGDHTLRPTALVHEAYLRLIDQRQVDFSNRAHFLGIAARMMRRILVNHARDRAAGKRGGGACRVSLAIVDAEQQTSGQLEVDLVALNDALERLHEIDERKSRVVELRFFGGLTNLEVADLLSVSLPTIERDWRFARAWLYDAVDSGA